MARLTDTPPAVERVRMRLLRQATPAQRMAIVDSMIQTGRELTLAGIRFRNPGASEAETERLLAIELLGPELAERVFAARGRS